MEHAGDQRANEPRRPRGGVFVITAIAAACLFTPAVAFVTGSRGRPIENRASRELPGASSGWNLFSDLGGFIGDRLPMRSDAVQADAWLDEHVYDEDPAFGGSATPRVIRGKDGFLFLADAIDTACSPNAPVVDTVAHLDRLASIITDSGREMVAMIAPDKSTIHPELLPEGMAKFACFDAYTRDLWASLAAEDIPGYIDLRALLTKEVVTSREPLYLRKDSHWDSRGSLAMVRTLVERLAPGLWDDAEVDYNGLGEYTGDLTGMQGNPEVDQAPQYVVTRADVSYGEPEVLDDIEGGFNRRFVNTAPAGRLIPGRTVLFLDSYGLVALPQIVPFFEDLTVFRLVDFPTENDRFISIMNDAERVMLLTVERSAGYRLSFEIGDPLFLDRLAANLETKSS